MKLITEDKYLDFVINNYHDIIAVNQLVALAKDKLPEWVNRHVRDIIYDLRTSFYSDLKLECDYNDGEIWWFDKDLYDDNSEKGIYFETGLDFKWDELVAQARDDGGWLYLYLQTGKMKKKEAEQRLKLWQNHLEDNKQKLVSVGIVLRPYDDDAYILAAYYLVDIVNIDIIRESKFPESLIEAVKKFTSALLPVLKSFNEK